MIIFFESGQFGNQLFQYCALKSLQKKGILLFIGLNDLRSVFHDEDDGDKTKLILTIKKLVSRIGKRRLNLLARKYKLIGIIEEYFTLEGSELRVENGIFKNIYYCDESYFQSEKFVDPLITEKLKIEPILLEQASNIFLKLPQDRGATFFVHVRRGDYTHWPSHSAPAVLPYNWYQEQMDQIRNKYTKPFFIVISNDGPYVDEMFGGFSDVYVSHESKGVDFALMCLCDDGGILSASSFAWWAAYFIRRNNDKALFIAPLYWAGHKQKKWYPIGIKTSWIKYVSVEYPPQTYDPSH